MTTIAKILIAAVLAVGIGGGVAIAQASNGRDDPAGKVRGPCDEAEHANDPRCTGAAGADDRGADDGVDDNGHHGQNSGHGGDDGSSGHGGSNSGHGGGEDD